VRSNSDERVARAHFDERYRVKGNAAAAAVEQTVIGAVWGANGYTTRDQADELAAQLRVGPGDRLLDIGTGRGWPALYLAQTTGCSVVGTDLPMAALQSANHRARREHIDDRAAVVVASGATLPFRTMQFDAVVHTDVLC
jgi:methylase of polypeptide subunit release factors